LEELDGARTLPKLGGEEKEKMNWPEDHPIFCVEGDGKTTYPVVVKKNNPNYLVVLFTVGTPTMRNQLPLLD
jgi:hypothetical protein